MKVAVFSIKKYERSFLEEATNHKHDLSFFKEALSVETASLAKDFDAISIFTNDDAGKEVLQILSKIPIQFIATRAAGYDNIDLIEAENVNIRIAHVPEYSPYAIAEHTVAMILSLNRKIVQADQQIRKYNFALDNLIGFDLHGKTIGIVGLGKIGSVLTKILSGFGCTLLAYDIKPNQQLVSNYAIEYVSLDELYKRSDIVTLHTPLNDSTKYLIRKESIDKMKTGVMLINTGRGGLVNTADAIKALEEGKIGYLGLDVYEKEKGLFFYDHSSNKIKDDLFDRLLTFKNVLVTGHQAFLTQNALKNIADTTCYNLNCFDEGIRSLHELTNKRL